MGDERTFMIIGAAMEACLLLAWLARRKFGGPQSNANPKTLDPDGRDFVLHWAQQRKIHTHTPVKYAPIKLPCMI